MRTVTRDLSGIFKAYDIRGVYPDDLDEDAARRIGGAFARFVKAPKVAVGRDMRISSPALADAFREGVHAAGVGTVDLGQVSTDALYFASGRLDVPGAMFTASHNPARYNGLKLCRERAAPIGSDSGLEDIRALAESDEVPTEGVGAGARPEAESTEILGDYSDHCRSFVDQSLLRPLKVAIDAGNGMAGATVPGVFEPLPFEVLPLYFELDGTFPNHPANPIEAENLVELQTGRARRGL